MAEHTNPVKSRGIQSKVLIVDDHALVRRGLIQVLNDEPDFVVCGEAGDAQSALAAIADLKPDVVVVDLTMPGINGLELTQCISAQWPELPILVLTMHNEPLYPERALRAGAKGYVVKHESSEVLALALRQVLKGQIYVSEKIAGKMMNPVARGKFQPDASPLAALSSREKEVLRWISHGASMKEIAERMNITVRTVDSHREHIKMKLNVPTAADLFRYSLQWLDQGLL